MSPDRRGRAAMMHPLHAWREGRQMRLWVAEVERRRRFLDRLASDVESADPERATAIRRLRLSPVIEPELNPDNPPVRPSLVPLLAGVWAVFALIALGCMWW